MRATAKFLAISLILLAAACTRAPEPEPAAGAAQQAVNRIADRYLTETLAFRPERAYFFGVELDRHDGLRDNRPAARVAYEAVEDELRSLLRDVDAAALVGSPEWTTHAYLSEALESSTALRICRTELWNVNHMQGWQSNYVYIAKVQPVGNPELREQSLARWTKFPGFIDQEVVNLRQGLEAGYSAPGTVVERVIAQLDGLLALDVEQSPFYSPAVRDSEAGFVSRTRNIVAEGIYPALRRYRAFLAEEYLPEARETLSVTANPDGAECYEASLRSWTTLDRSAKDVYELGQRTVAENREAVIKLGQELYGLTDFAAIVERATSDVADRFKSQQELLEFSREAVRRAASETPRWVGRMPDQPVEVVPFDEHEEGTGRSAHYIPGAVGRPAEYRIPLDKPEEQSRGQAEITAFHETFPGHHLQNASASTARRHPVLAVLWFSGPGEGWARYAQGLAEEMGLYTTRTAPLLRRAWPARGMVVDPGIHLFGWTREQARAYIVESGFVPESEGDALVDRIAIQPGQLTAYDSGGLEILDLRREAEAALGNDLDIRDFHDQVLSYGTTPLGPLRSQIEAWIQDSIVR